MHRSVPAALLGLFALLAFEILMPLPGKAVQPPDPDRPSKLEWIVQERIFKLDQTLGSRHEKGLAAAELKNLDSPDLQVDAAGRLFLTFRADRAVNEEEKAELRSLGASLGVSTADIRPFRGRSLVPPGYGAIDAWIPYDRVEAAADLPWVTSVSAIGSANGDVGSVTSQGVRLHRADVAHANGIDGAGVTVGVISTGSKNFEEAIRSGDLPADVTLLDPSHLGDDEGTAMMEIVHDMAPGAKLLFYPVTDLSANTYVLALQTLAEAGADVIAEDIPLDHEPAFQQGVAAMAAQQLAEAGISIYGSAGNLGLSHAPRIRAIGTRKGPNGNIAFRGCSKAPHNVVTTFDVYIPAGTKLSATLQWSEPGNHAFTNLDLYLMDYRGATCLEQSLGFQGGGTGIPLEQLDHAATEDLVAKLVVNLADDSTAAAPPLIDLRWRSKDKDHQIFSLSRPGREGSLNPNVNFTTSATSVAAANASVSTNPRRVPLEKYSGAGPLILESTTVCRDGVYPCSKGVPGRLVFQGGGPAWTAADKALVSDAISFGPVFSGTSAAAPHAAGCDALIRQQLEREGVRPTLSKIQERMAQMAVRRGDRTSWGNGVLVCFPF